MNESVTMTKKNQKKWGDRKDAMKAVAKDRGIKKSDVYAELKVRKE